MLHAVLRRFRAQAGWLGLLLTIALMTAFSVARAETPRELYDQGKYQEALTLLQGNGLKGADDYYNAGNCLFKLGKLGLALAHYEKANALAPGHPDIQYNLELTSDMLAKSGSLPKDRSFWTGRVVPIARRIPSPVIFLAMTLSSGLVAWFAYRTKRRRDRAQRPLLSAPLLAVVGSWLLVLAGAYSFYLANSTQLGAVVGENAVMRSGPAQTFTELMPLPAGTKVEVLDDSREGWRQIRFSLGNVGWIMEKDLLTL
jgi:tetratricopeptide (TPR) repeat protein